MAVFIVVAIRSPEKIKGNIEGFISEANRLLLKEGVWLVDYDGTSKLLAEKLQIRAEPPSGTGIVFPITNYSGRASDNVWEWLGAHLTARRD